MNISAIISQIDLCVKTMEKEPIGANTLHGYTIDNVKPKDLDIIGKTSSRGQNDAVVLQEADACVVIRDAAGRPVHYSCAAINSFLHPRIEDRLHIGHGEAYIYAVETNPAHRGKRLAGHAIQQLHCHLYWLGIRAVLSHYYKKNQSSRDLFAKLGYAKYGSVVLCSTDQQFSWVAFCHRRFFDKPERAFVNNIWIYDAVMSEYERIRKTLTPIITELYCARQCVALYGSGGDATSLSKIVYQLSGMVKYVFDGNPLKANTLFSSLNIPVKPSHMMSELKYDAIILTSNAHQDEMFNYAFNNCPPGTRIIRLYPEVAEYRINA